MKSYIYRIAVLLITVGHSFYVQAQDLKKNVPAVVEQSLKTKYPTAHVRNWQVKDGTYCVRASIQGHTYLVSFNQAGQWLSSATKVNWPWHLPAAVKDGFEHSKYGNWNIYSVKKLYKPEGEYYQITVDDRNQPVDIDHQNLVTERRAVDVTAAGKVTGIQDASL